MKKIYYFFFLFTHICCSAFAMEQQNNFYNYLNEEAESGSEDTTYVTFLNNKQKELTNLFNQMSLSESIEQSMPLKREYTEKENEFNLALEKYVEKQRKNR